MKISTQKGFIIPLIGGIVALLIAGGIYWAWHNKSDDNYQLGGPKDVASLTGMTSTTTGSDSIQVTSTQATSNWKTYTNSQYDYSFNYPATYNISDDTYSGPGETVKIIANNNPNMSIEFNSRKMVEGSSTLSQWVVNSAPPGSYNPDVVLTVINGQQAMIDHYLGYDVYYLVNRDVGYVIGIRTDESKSLSADDQEKKNILQILNSFKFTN